MESADHRFQELAEMKSGHHLGEHFLWVCPTASRFV